MLSAKEGSSRSRRTKDDAVTSKRRASAITVAVTGNSAQSNIAASAKLSPRFIRLMTLSWPLALTRCSITQPSRIT